MIAEIKQDARFVRLEPASMGIETLKVMADRRPTQLRVRLEIPEKYYHEPVISRLISEYKLSVNVTGAFLPVDGGQHGWFELELLGPSSQILAGLLYLNQLEVLVWSQLCDPDQENW